MTLSSTSQKLKIESFLIKTKEDKFSFCIQLKYFANRKRLMHYNRLNIPSYISCIGLVILNLNFKIHYIQAEQTLASSISGSHDSLHLALSLILTWL